MQHIPTDNIKIASALVALGFKLRQPDPVTCIQEIRKGKPFDQFTFWFDGDKGEIIKLINAGEDFLKSGEYQLPPEHKFYYILGGLFNRETLLNYMRQCTPFTMIHTGQTAIILPVNASEGLKKKLRSHL